MPLPTIPIDPRTEALRNAPLDSWIALAADETRVLASGATYSEVSKQLDEMGVENSVIIKTPKSWVRLAI